MPQTADSLKLAVMSCSNYPAGFFNVYSEVAKSDAEFALHLGDYIYDLSVEDAMVRRLNAPDFLVSRKCLFALLATYF